MLVHCDSYKERQNIAREKWKEKKITQNRTNRDHDLGFPERKLNHTFLNSSQSRVVSSQRLSTLHSRKHTQDIPLKWAMEMHKIYGNNIEKEIMLYGNNISWNYFFRFSFQIYNFFPLLCRFRVAVSGVQCAFRRRHHDRIECMAAFPFVCSIFFAWLKLLYAASCVFVCAAMWHHSSQTVNSTDKAIKMICCTSQRLCAPKLVVALPLCARSSLVKCMPAANVQPCAFVATCNLPVKSCILPASWAWLFEIITFHKC